MSTPLAEQYFDLLFDLPEALRMRRSLEHELAQAMTHGHHACIRGFSRIGKSTLLRGTLAAACERTQGAAIVIDLAAGDTGSVTLKTSLEQVAHKVQAFLSRVGATELKASPENPLEVLGELAAPLFVGIDEIVTLSKLSPADATSFFAKILNTPKNVKVCLAAEQHRSLDAHLDRALAEHSNVALVQVPPLSDEELVNLIQTPAQQHHVHFSNEALGVLAEFSGNRPVELLTLAGLAAQSLDAKFQGAISPEHLEPLLSIDALAESEVGQTLVNGWLATLFHSMTDDERKLVELVAAGGEAEIDESAVASLKAAAILADTEALQLNGSLLELLARAVALGEIKVTVAV